MHIAIVGGAGFVGHHLALNLTQLGHEVSIVDSLMVNNLYHHRENPMYLGFINERLRLLEEVGVQLWRTDARDYHTMNGVIMPLKPDCIVHLSAIAHIDRANKDPMATFDHNLRTLENTLDIARSLGNAHVVYFSSSTVYGDFKTPVVTEESPCKPFGIYGALKLAGEHLVRGYGQVYDMPCTVVRPIALYGPRCVSGRVGQKFIESARQGKPITIFGDGQIYEDFTFIDDLVQGVTRVIQYRGASRDETFNIAAGKAHSLQQLAEIVSREYGVEIHYGPHDPEKPHRGTLSIDKARRLLGYAPEHDLEAGMEKYMRWYNAL